MSNRISVSGKKRRRTGARSSGKGKKKRARQWWIRRVMIEN
jgi:hypothetical protein